MEEMLGNTQQVRKVFEDWMTWNPSENAWDSYVKFEQRQKDFTRCREVLQKYIDSNPTPRAYIKAAKFEETHR
jgi:crooked neck